MYSATSTTVDPISAGDAAEHARRGAVLVDLRPQVVRHEGSLPGAVVVDPTDVGAVMAPDNPRGPAGLDGLDTEIAVVSISSQARRLAERIAALGYTNVRWVDGGFLAMRSCLGAA